LGKESYEFVDLSLKKKIEKELKDRESKIHKYYKICLRCGQLKMLYEFSREKRNTDGKLGVCKDCKSREALKYYYENREKILVKVKKYQENHKRDRSTYFENYQRNNKERLKKIASAWYKENKKEIKKRNLKYYEENKEACQARRKLWIKNHKEEIKKYNREYQKLRK
jgi:hypothetical protein